MKIELARHSGFCSGVRGAVVRIVGELGRSEDDICIYGPLIHNPQTVEILDSRGLKTVDSLDSVNGKTAAIRTHGETRETYREIRSRARRVINLTCPKVSRVHSIVKKYSSQGYHIIILGDRDHAEVQGIMSQATGGVTVVSSLDEICDIPATGRYAVVAQTTLDITFFDRAVEVIGKRLGDVTVINTICDATSNRQNDLIDAIGRGVDAIVVVGGKNSANTRRLAGIGMEHGIRTFHVETEEELSAEDFHDVKHVLVSAGASTPSWIINDVLERLHHIKYTNSLLVAGWLKSFIELIIRTNVVSSIMTGFMTFAVGILVKRPRVDLAVAAGLFIFLMYSVNNYFQRDSLKISNAYKFRLYMRYTIPLLVVNLLVLACVIFLMPGIGSISRILFLGLLFLGSIYSTPPVRYFTMILPGRWLRRMYRLKSLAATLGWIFVAVCIPYVEDPYDVRYFLAIMFITGAIIFMRNIILDMIAYQADLIIGVETFPTVLGIRKTRIVMYGIAALAFASSIYGVSLTMSLVPFLFAVNLVYGLYLFYRIDTLQYFYSLKYEALADFNLLVFVLILFTVAVM